MDNAHMDASPSDATLQTAVTERPGPVCSVCPLFRGCQAICEPVEELLPSMERGRVDAADLPNLYMGIRFTHLLLDNVQLLTPHQQEVVRLYYRETLRQQEIAELLEVSQQAVHDALQRARQTVAERAMTTRGRPETRGPSRGGIE